MNGEFGPSVAPRDGLTETAHNHVTGQYTARDSEGDPGLDLLHGSFQNDSTLPNWPAFETLTDPRCPHIIEAIRDYPGSPLVGLRRWQDAWRESAILVMLPGTPGNDTRRSGLRMTRR
jgi:hypothetical protein